jgi:penicillin-binding protein 2
MKIARTSVVQHYLDHVNAITGRDEKVNAEDLNKHFARELLLPYTLVDDLEPTEYARLLERLPVNSPTQVYPSSTRHYPYGSAAAHTLGYVGATEDVALEDFPGEDLKTFKMKGTTGRDGVEKQFDDVLQGEAGGAIYRVDPSGNRLPKPIQQVFPKQGKNVQLSLDIDLQRAAEAKLGETEMAGGAVAIDVATGEVLVLANKPDYDLSQFAPRLTAATAADINARGAWLNRSTQGTYMPGSSFKILVTIAGFRSGVILPDSTNLCQGVYRIGNMTKDCHDRHATATSRSSPRSRRAATSTFTATASKWAVTSSPTRRGGSTSTGRPASSCRTKAARCSFRIPRGSAKRRTSRGRPATRRTSPSARAPSP